MFVAALVLFAGQAEAVPELPRLKAYLGCARDEAKRLEPSGETAETVARAAIVRCEPQLAAAAKEFRAASDARMRELGWPTSTPGQISTYMDEMPKIRAKAEEVAITEVVEERADRQAH